MDYLLYKLVEAGTLVTLDRKAVNFSSDTALTTNTARCEDSTTSGDCHRYHRLAQEAAEHQNGIRG